ncbi:MAG: hypothetical protein ACW981_04565 [Candidatus Hodarchaeales archaeon]|jgi:hypothetical protein
MNTSGKWIEITQGKTEPKVLLNSYPGIVFLIQKHSELFFQKSKIKSGNLSWFFDQKLYGLFDKDQLLALMREIIPFSIKSGFIEHELIVLPETSISQQISFLDLFQKKILHDLPRLCKISAFLTYHPINIDPSSFITYNKENFHHTDNQIRSIILLSRNSVNDQNHPTTTKFAINEEKYIIEVLKKPLNEKDFEEFKEISKSAVYEVNQFIKNELIRNYFNKAKIGENSYQEYIENWKSLSDSITIVIRIADKIIGYTQIVRHAFILKMAFQHMTYIIPPYRGKRLSKELKNFSYNYLITNESWNDYDTIMTNNHSNNLSMLKVNAQMGFKKVAYFSGWNYDL